MGAPVGREPPPPGHVEPWAALLKAVALPPSSRAKRAPSAPRDDLWDPVAKVRDASAPKRKRYVAYDVDEPIFVGRAIYTKATGVVLDLTVD